jgi:hypothetical protein
MRRWKRILLSLLIVSITFFYPLLAPTPHRIDKSHCDLIVRGMTQDQVESIFGVPAGQYDWAEDDDAARYRLYMRLMRAADEREASRYVVLGLSHDISRRLRSNQIWTSRHGSFTVWFGEDQRVLSTDAWTAVRIVPPWQRWWNQYWKK